jgi:hypothetical protein
MRERWKVIKQSISQLSFHLFGHLLASEDKIKECKKSKTMTRLKKPGWKLRHASIDIKISDGISEDNSSVTKSKMFVQSVIHWKGQIETAAKSQERCSMENR